MFQIIPVGRGKNNYQKQKKGSKILYNVIFLPNNSKEINFKLQNLIGELNKMASYKINTYNSNFLTYQFCVNN